MVYSFGLMVGSTKGVGRMENNTVKVITHLPQEKLNMENGKKENVFNGFHEITPGDEKSLVRACAEHGPIAVSIDASKVFKLFFIKKKKI